MFPLRSARFCIEKPRNIEPGRIMRELMQIRLERRRPNA
jgi:hypothetical protein